MKKIVSILGLSAMACFISISAYADQVCMDSCMARNYATKFCESKCSGVNPLLKQASDRRIEPSCFSDCTSTGHDQAYCTKSCVY